MKILVATPIYPPEIGGPATYAKELAKHLHEKHNITIVAYTDVRGPFPGTKLIAVSKKQPLPVRLVKFFLAVWKASQWCDLIYVQNAMAAGLPVALVSIFRKKPFVLKFVGDEAWERATQHKLIDSRLEEFLEHPSGGLKIRLMMMVQGFVLRRASIVITPSKYLGQAIEKAYGINPSRVVTNYNATEDTEKLPFEPTRVRHQIMTTARLVAWKGVRGIIEGVRILKQRYPDIRLMIAGDGPEMSDLQSLSQKLDVRDEVIFLGKVSRAETWRLRKNSEVYVLNSTYEGLPHTVLTSFAAEIPVVATNIPGTNEAVYGEDTGLLVEPEHPEEVARAIERLFEDEALRKRLVLNGKKLLENKFSWQTHIENLESIFRNAISQAK